METCLDANLPGPIWPLHRVSHLREHLIWMRLQGRADRTLLARRREMVRLAEHLGADPLHASYEALYGWQMHLAGTSVTLMRWATTLVRPYYRWCHETGHRPDNPAALLPVPRRRPGLPRPIAEERLRVAVAQAPPRVLPWLLLAGWSGLRAAEIAALRVEDVFVDDTGQIWWRVVGKGGLTRHVPVPDWAWPAIAATLPASGPAWRRLHGTGPVKAKHVSQYCNEHLHRVGIPDTLHALRHRVATVTYEQTGDLRLVQDLLGHADIATTAVYTRVASRRLASAVSDLPRVELPRHRHLHAVPTTHGGTA